MYQIMNPPRLWMAWVGVGHRCRLSTQKATWRAGISRSHPACSSGAVLRYRARCSRAPTHITWFSKKPPLVCGGAGEHRRVVENVVW